MVVVTRENIRGNLDFEACFPPKDKFGKPLYKPDYSTANAAIKGEWAYLRHVCKRYGFGRHQLQPMRKTGEALGHYLGDYLSADWNNRWPEDKGARCIRYFGHWSTEPRRQGERRTAAPYGSRLAAEQVAAWLNCQPSDVRILMAARLLKPLGNPPANSVKFFATVELQELVKDKAWLAKVTNVLNQHWQKKNAAKKDILANGSQNGHVMALNS